MTDSERNVQIYQATAEYLKSIAPENIDIESYFIGDNIKANSLKDVFIQFIGSAQNYQQMPNVIRFDKRRAEIGKLLSDYDIATVSTYSPDELYASFRKAFSVTSTDSKHNSWYKWSCSIVDSAKFLKQFKDFSDFDRFVRCFDYNAVSQIALPLLIQSQVKGIGFALACDLLKELGYVNYPKPDIHLLDVFTAIGLCENNQMSVFMAVRQMADDCEAVDPTATPYKVDKTFWLICSGYFYKDQVRIKRHKQELIDYLKTIGG